jgi:hypothetical protein
MLDSITITNSMILEIIDYLPKRAEHDEPSKLNILMPRKTLRLFVQPVI